MTRLSRQKLFTTALAVDGCVVSGNLKRTGARLALHVGSEMTVYVSPGRRRRRLA